MYALVTGLAKKVVDVVRAPIETKVIEEIKKPPPPPEIVLPPPPKLEAPPPPYIPPPEVQIAAPPPPQPTISVAPSPTPPPPTVMTPTPPVVAVAPAPPAPRPTTLSIGVACSKQVQPTMPARAMREGITGSVKARATIKGGKVIAVEIISSQPRGVFDAAVRSAMMQYGCQTGEEEVKAEQAFDFKLE
ncbi:MAG: energy transducer TonB [Burkholderiales bacterium]